MSGNSPEERLERSLARHSRRFGPLVVDSCPGCQESLVEKRWLFVGRCLSIACPMEVLGEVRSVDGGTTLGAVCGGRRVVVDFWTTKCTRCPAALGKLDKLASTLGKDVLVASVCLDVAEGDADLVEGWSNVSHFFASPELKEKAKTAFNFATVPHVVVLDQNGRVSLSASGVGLAPHTITAALHDKENFCTDDDDF